MATATKKPLGKVIGAGLRVAHPSLMRVLIQDLLERPSQTKNSRAHLDGAIAWMCRAQDVCGGLDLSQAQQSLIRRAAAIECELELLEGRLSLGQPVDLDVFTRSASHLRRILETLGIRRVPREIDPGLDTYLTTSKHHDGREVVDVTTQPAGGTLSPQPDASEASESSEAEPEGAA